MFYSCKKVSLDCGKKNVNLLITVFFYVMLIFHFLSQYAVFLFIILVLLIAAGIAAGVFKDQVKPELQKFLNNTLINEYGTKNDAGDPSAITLAWDQMQYKVHCL